MPDKVSTMDVRQRLGDMLNRVALRHDEFIIERKGQPLLAEDRLDRAGSYTTNLDGKDSPVTGNPNADTIAVRRIDARTVEMVSKKGGKITTTQRNVASADGKTRTVTTTGTDAQGQKIHNVGVFERQ